MSTRTEATRELPYHSQAGIKRTQIVVLFVALLASALFASFVSPQISLWGRGLRLSLPLFVLLGGVVLSTRPEAIRYLGKYGGALVAGVLYIVTGTLHYLLEPVQTIFQNFVISAAICIMLWMVILLVRKGFPEAVETIRWLTLVTLGISLGMGIPLLLEQPGVARLTMGNPLADIYAAQFYPRGVANYSWYTPVAFAFPAIANWLYKSPRGRGLKILGWGCLLAASAATLFATFTMAAVLLVAGAFAWLVPVAVTSQRRGSRLFATVIIIALLISFPTLYLLGSEFDATKLIVIKATQLFERTLTEGPLEGDMTGRTEMFAGSLGTFARNPIFGGWGLDPNFYIGGHSSWADTLGAQGLVGLLLWMGFLMPSLRRGKKSFSVEKGSAGGTLSWILFALGGILNPTFYSEIGLILIWLFDACSLWQTLNRERSRG